MSTYQDRGPNLPIWHVAFLPFGLKPETDMGPYGTANFPQAMRWAYVLPGEETFPVFCNYADLQMSRHANTTRVYSFSKKNLDKFVEHFTKENS